MTHNDITIGTDVAMDVHCHDVIMSVFDNVRIHTDVARTLTYYVLLHQIIIFLFFLVKSLKLYIKH